MPRPRPVPGTPAPAAEPTTRPLAATSRHEMDAVLERDPNTGVFQGLRVALLFNAGLALSGLLAWELWAMIVG